MEQKEEAWTVERMVEMLKTGIVDFEFEKADGTTRSALGTLVPEMLPDRLAGVKEELLGLSRRAMKTTPDELVEELQRLGEKVRFIEDGTSKHSKNPNTVYYYDLQKGEFRSFNFGRFLSVNGVWPCDSRKEIAGSGRMPSLAAC